ncbi:MAG TPA: hypothetical protein VGO47_06535, partial [Chlamydiales bacterium]|nr:hypothetical protein [Chlamydiales bacterium]
ALEELEPKELVSVVKIGEFANLMDGPFCSSIREIGAFKLVCLKSLGDCEYRVEGCAFATKEQLKHFLRLLSRYESGNHLHLGFELGFWGREGEHIIWTHSGLALRLQIVAFLKKSFGSEEFKAASVSVFDQFGLNRARKGDSFSAWMVFEKTIDPEGDEGFFEEQCQTVAQQTIYCAEKEIVELAISLLQRIGKTLIILGFNPELRLAGRRQGEKGVKLLSFILSNDKLDMVPGNVEIPFEVDDITASRVSRIRWMVRDGLDRMHSVIELEIGYKEDGLAILRAKAGVERILSLLLEQNSGNLPDWLISEKKR